MKSIKEMAEEYSFIEQGIDPLGIQFRDFDIKKQEGFETGANYVLDILGKELPSEDNKNLNDYGKALVWRLKNCIEQLKK